MQKFRFEQRSFDSLKPGDRIAVAGHGILQFQFVESLAEGYRRMHLKTATGEWVHSTQHVSNWPEVAVGFTRAYSRAYPHESF